MKKYRKTLLILAVVLSIAIAAGSTMAYLQDTDEDVNVMTLGNVYINQLEYERVPTEGHELTNDAWESTGETDKYGFIPDEIRPFTQAKPLMPAVFADGIIKWDDRLQPNAADEHQQSWADVKGEKVTGAPGSFQLFDDSVKNVIDKFVFVENTGSADAYVRTWFAFELGAVAPENFEKVIMLNTNDANGEADGGHWAWAEEFVPTEIDGNQYMVTYADYLGPKSNPTGILAPGTISYVSLAQVYMKPEATNDDVIAIDGNQNGTYDILVMSQAVQAKGFESATAALNEAFGEESPWNEENKPQFPKFIMNVQDLWDASQYGGEYLLGADIEITEALADNYGTYVKTKLKIDLNGYGIKMNVKPKEDSSTYYYGMFYVCKGGTLDIVGNGTMDMAQADMPLIWCTGEGSTVNIYGGHWTETSDILNETFDNCEGIYARSYGTVNIYGGTFDWDCNPQITVNESNKGVINLYGGEFKATPNFVYGSGDPSMLAEGYGLEEYTDVDGNVWQKVVKQ